MAKHEMPGRRVARANGLGFRAFTEQVREAIAAGYNNQAIGAHFDCDPSVISRIRTKAKVRRSDAKPTGILDQLRAHEEAEPPNAQTALPLDGKDDELRRALETLKVATLGRDIDEIVSKSYSHSDENWDYYAAIIRSPKKPR